MADQSPQVPASGSAPWPVQYPTVRQQYRGHTQFNPAMRAATADRERTVDVLKAGFAEGRLTQDEYNDRMAQAYASKTYAELSALTADLPAGASMPTMMAHAPWPPGPLPRTRTNSLAVASMILGFAVPVFGLTAIPAVVCGHKARQEIKQNGEQGDGMAVVGLVLGYLAIIGWTLLFLAFMAWAGNHSGGYTPGPGGPGGFGPQG